VPRLPRALHAAGAARPCVYVYADASTSALAIHRNEGVAIVRALTSFHSEGGNDPGTLP
jgi:hypothetical protein